MLTVDVAGVLEEEDGDEEDGDEDGEDGDGDEEEEEGDGDEEDGDGEPDPDEDPVGDGEPDPDEDPDGDGDFAPEEDLAGDGESLEATISDGGRGGSADVNVDGLKNTDADGPWMMNGPIPSLCADGAPRSVGVAGGVGPAIGAVPAAGG
ncbi:MAG: hypothetical protein ACLP8X_01970 [Streptosporangiaceae bacterium]